MTTDISRALGPLAFALLLACSDGPAGTATPAATPDAAVPTSTPAPPDGGGPASTPVAPSTDSATASPGPVSQPPQPEHSGSVTFSVRATGTTSPLGYTVNYSLGPPTGCLPRYGCIGLFEFEFEGGTFTGTHVWLANVYFYLTPWNTACRVTSTNPVLLTVDEWRPNDVAFDVSCP
jgi:hypothetical protein